MSMSSTILLVDDSPTILNILQMILNQEGFKILTAQDGVEALERLAGAEVELMIADINMPRMDGYTLIKEVRARSEYQTLPVIIISTQDRESDRKRALDLGADLFLRKPVPPDDLVAEVRRLLDSGRPC